MIIDVEERIQKAYSMGKAEGEGSFQSGLEQVAAQVYDHVHQQLSKIQEEKARQTLEKVRYRLRDVL
jgi:hypothetical protein